MHEKTTLIILLALLALPVSSQSSSNALNIRWRAEIGPTSEEVTSNIVFIQASDINNDKLGEVIAVSGGSVTASAHAVKNMIYAFDRDGNELWTKGLDDEITSAYVKDIDRDGFQEIVVSAGQRLEEISRGRIFIITETGEIIRTIHSSSIVLSMHITDLDGDKLDDFIGGSSQRVRVFDSYGLNKWNYATYNQVNDVLGEDVFGDELKEVLVGANTLYVLDSLGKPVYTLNISELTGKQYDAVSEINLLHSPGRSQPFVAITTKYGTKLHLFEGSYNRSLSSKYELVPYWESDFGERIVSVLFTDLNGDESDEVLVGTEDDYLTALTGAGELMWSFKANGDVMDMDVADINSDARGEVVFGTVSGTIYVLSKETGEYMWRYDLNEPIQKIAVADLEGDPYKEILVGTMNRLLYLFEVNQTFTDLQMAEDLYFKAQEFYIISEYNLSLDYLKRANQLYIKLKDTVGIAKTEDLMDSIDEKISGVKRIKADMFYDKCQEYFISGDYLQAKNYCEMSKAIYDEFRDSQNSIKAELLLLRIAKMIDKTIVDVTTMVFVEENSTGPASNINMGYVTLAIALVVLVVGLIIKKKRSAETMEKYMTEYEKDLEKVIEEDLAELGGMGRMSGEE